MKRKKLSVYAVLLGKAVLYMRQFRVMSVMTTSIRLRVNYLVIIINLGANVKAKNNSVCKHNYSFRKSNLMNSEEVISKPQRHMPLGLWLFRTI